MKIIAIYLAALAAVASAQQCSIADFHIVDAATGQKIGRLGKTLDYTKLSTKSINVITKQSSCTGQAIDSVLFEFDGVKTCEKYLPYAVFKDRNTNGPDITDPTKATYFKYTIKPGGPHKLKATPFYTNDCTGPAGPVLQRKFDVVDDACPGSITGFNLWSDTTNKMIGPIKDGDTICKSQGKINIEAVATACPGGQIRSVFLELQGPTKKSRMENFAPYLLAGDKIKPRDIMGTSLAAGSYVLTATPHSRFNLRGSAGTPGSLSFTVKNC